MDEKIRRVKSNKVVNDAVVRNAHQGKEEKSRLQESERMASLRSVITVFFCRFIRALFLLENYCNECVTRESYTSSLTADFWRRADSGRLGQTEQKWRKKIEERNRGKLRLLPSMVNLKKGVFFSYGAHFYHLWSPTEIVKHDPKRDVIPKMILGVLCPFNAQTLWKSDANPFHEQEGS